MSRWSRPSAGFGSIWILVLHEGAVQNNWPEYFGQPTSAALEGLKAEQNSIPNVYLQVPSSAAPFNPGNPEDVWVYGDGDGNVVGIPARGVWHPNRVSPGWPDLAGRGYKEAIDTIVSEVAGVKVIYGPEGFPRIMDVNKRRVWLDVDQAGNVAIVPHLG